MFGWTRPTPLPLAAAIVLGALAAGAATVPTIDAPSARGQGEVALRMLDFGPLTWDPARAGDASSAAVIAQVFEGLTMLDAANNVQPALAESWTVADDGRHIDFKLRSGTRYSDGSPITAQHVVDSWLKLLDPQRPGPLVALLTDIAGAPEYLGGRAGRDAVGLRAQGDHVLVDLRRPATYFVAATSSPSLAVVPPASRDRLDSAEPPDDLVVSGAYVPKSMSETVIRFEANDEYWAGRPTLPVIDLVTDTENRPPLDMFEAGELDYMAVSSFDAAWMRYERELGPQLRTTGELSVHYYGFETTAPPFDDALVRRAFGQAVNWDRIVTLAGRRPARSLVPPGMPGGGTADYRPAYDPAAARAALAQAGYAGGTGFPAVVLTSNGYGYEAAVASELERELGIEITVEYREFSDIQARRAAGERPALWVQTWVADYPHAHDFLGLLLETGSASNDGHWSNAAYDAALEAAAATADAAEQERHYATAQAIVRDEVPVVPVEALSGWALSRNGLLNALPSGVGVIRFADLAWASDGR